MRKNLVILGCGWGSYSVLKNVSRAAYDITVISPRNHFLFTPLLASTTVGTLEFRSIIEPVRNTGFRRADHFHLAWAKSLDPSSRVVSCQSVLVPTNEYEVRYDKLVIGVGALSNTYGIPGVEQHAYFLKEIADARKIRNRILNNFELAVQPWTSFDEKKRLLHTVIVGGGPTGIEFGAELYDFVKQDVTRLYATEAQMVKVTLVESNKILSSFDSHLQAYAEKKISGREQFSIVKASVTAVSANAVILNDGRILPCGLIVWSTGLAPQPFTKSLKLPKNSLGQLLTDDHLCMLENPSVYALGDCAEISGTPLPNTAQVAERQGRYLAKALNHTDPERTEPFSFSSSGMLAYIGSYEALSDLPDVKLHGYSSWFLWRSAYLTRLGSWRLRMQVPLDWMKTFLFGRDISRF